MTTELEWADASTRYLPWIGRMVRGQDHQFLLETMGNVEFRWVVTEDERRESDGRNVRRLFCEEKGLEAEAMVESLPASFLEVVLSLALEMDGLVAERPDKMPVGVWTWFWEMMANVGLDRFDDISCQEMGYRTARDRIERTCERVMDRRYAANGRGGLFPMPGRRRREGEDQREVELWYQLNEYVLRTGRG